MIILIAFLLDKLVSEPKKYHPLVAFGLWAYFLEKHLNNTQISKFNGIAGVVIALTPIVSLAVYIDNESRTHIWLHILVSGFILYVAIGWQSLISHAQQIIIPLKENDLEKARESLSMIVSRNTLKLDEKGVAKAATESVLENGADAIFSALFWFCVLGVPGVVLYRLANTLDAMWGYKNERFFYFGWCAARLDDVLNFIPARLTALSYAMVGQCSIAIHCWHHQAFNWKSPNQGPVMAAGAGALNVTLGGEAVYHGKKESRPILGPKETEKTKANANTIQQACSLVNKAIALWVIVIAIFGCFL